MRRRRRITDLYKVSPNGFVWAVTMKKINPPYVYMQCTLAADLFIYF